MDSEIDSTFSFHRLTRAVSAGGRSHDSCTEFESIWNVSQSPHVQSLCTWCFVHGAVPCMPSLGARVRIWIEAVLILGCLCSVFPMRSCFMGWLLLSALRLQVPLGLHVQLRTIGDGHFLILKCDFECWSAISNVVGAIPSVEMNSLGRKTRKR